jgi:spermidine synthase
VRISLWLAALIDLALGVFLLARGRKHTGRVPRARVVVALAVSLAFAIGAFLMTRMDPLTLASSVYRSGHPQLNDGSKMLFYGDGKTASVALYEGPGNDGHRSIATNGKVDASITTLWGAPPSPDEFTMTLAAAIPLAMHANPRSVAVIGFGSGMTAHTFLGSDRVQHVDIVEIEPLMVKAAHLFGERVARVYSDPRANIVIDDAKAYLAGGAQKYDVIVSEPSNPWMGGTAALFSEEFYRFVPQHLTDDGIFVQWLQLYEITPDLVASILKAMLPRFADVQAYITNGSDVLLVASPSSRLPALAEIVERDPRLKLDLSRINVRDAVDLGEFYVLDRQALSTMASFGSLPANSDYFPILQLEAPKARFMNAGAGDAAMLQIAPWPLLEATVGFSPLPVSRNLSLVPTTAWRDLRYRAAREMRTALLDNAPIDAQYARKDQVLQLNLMQTAARACAIENNAIDWIEASAVVAAATIPYIRAEDLQGVWIEPSWFGHCKQSMPIIDNVLRLHASLARRDWNEVAEEGSALLAANETWAMPAFRSYVLGATQLAFLAIGDYDAVARAEESYGAGVSEHERERQWLLALANARRSAAKPH